MSAPERVDPRATNEGLKSSYRLALAQADHARDRARVAAVLIHHARYGRTRADGWSSTGESAADAYASEPSVAEWLATARDWQDVARAISRAIVWDDTDLYPPF
jgi:hypothetical protein